MDFGVKTKVGKTIACVFHLIATQAMIMSVATDIHTVHEQLSRRFAFGRYPN